MSDSVQREGIWWHQRADGSWLRWDQQSGAWQESAGPAPTTKTPPYRELVTRRQWAIGLLALVGGVSLIALVSDLVELSLLNRIARGEAVTQAEAEASDQRQALIALSVLGALIFAAIAFIRWFHAAYSNLPALGATGLRYKRGWAIGAWFVPILGLWRPKQIANDIWRASDPDAPPQQGEAWRGRPVPALLGWWWALWILANISGGFIGGPAEGDSIESFQAVSTFNAVGDGLTVVAAVLAILVVRTMTERQEARARSVNALQSERPATPAP